MNLMYFVLIFWMCGCALSATVEYDFTIAWLDANPDGIARKVIGINGNYPAPTIEATIGDTLVVNVANSDIVNGTSLHFHGMYQRGTPFMDGSSWVSQCPIPPGSSFQYTFTLNQSGTYWYHGHTLTNYVDGLYGALIIHELAPVYAYDDELVLLLGDWHHLLGFDLLATFMSSKNPQGEEPSPNSVVFNGIGQANCSLINPTIIDEDNDGTQPNSINDIDPAKEYLFKTCANNVVPEVFSVTSSRAYRFRIINTSAFTRLWFSIDGHSLTIIEADGTDTAQLAVDVLSIDVGQRYSVLVIANQKPGRYMIRASADPSMGFANPLSGTAVLQYSGVLGSSLISVPTITNPNVLEPFDLRPYQVQVAPSNPVQAIQLDMDFDENNHDINMAYINNISYAPSSTPAIVTAYNNGAFPPSSNVYTITTSGVVEIVLNNRDSGDHPWHFHGHKFAILGLGAPGDGDYNPNNASQVLNLDNPLWRDVVTVHQGSYLVARFNADNPGIWLLHCHIEWHMESGLSVLINELPGLQQSSYTIPSSIPLTCTSPVAAPDMTKPATYGGRYLGSSTASSTAANALYVAAFLLAAMLV